MTTYDAGIGKETGRMTQTYDRNGYPLISTVENPDGGAFIITYDWDLENMVVITESVLRALNIELSKTLSKTVIVATDQYGNWTEKRSYELKKRYGREEWVLTNVYQRNFTYRRR